MSNYYPARRKGQGSSLVPSFNQHNNFRMPANIIPRYDNDNNNRNLAAQVKTRIRIKNAKGEFMDLYQTQQVLNLLNNNRSNWVVGGNNHIHRNYKGRKQ